jgi:hypothetical protein
MHSRLYELKLVVKSLLQGQRKAKIHAYSAFTDETVKPSFHWLALWTLQTVTESTKKRKGERTAKM